MTTQTIVLKTAFDPAELEVVARTLLAGMAADEPWVDDDAWVAL